MALSGTDRGTGTHNTAALSFTLSPGSNFTAGAMAVLCLSVDNADSSGAAHSTFTVTDTLGNTWTRRTSPLYDPGSAAAGVEGAAFTSPQNGGTLQTGTVITVTFDANTTAKVWTLMEVVGSVGTPAYKNQGVGTGSATAAPTVTTASIPSGQMVIGLICNEYGTAQTPTGDSDTTNGSWSTMQTAEVGTTAAGQTIITQRKVVTATATQTYNPTLGTSSDCKPAWISIGEDISVSAGTGVIAFAGLVPVVSVSNNVLVAAGFGSFVYTGLVPVITSTEHVIVSAGLGLLTYDGLVPVVIASDHKIVSADFGSMVYAGFVPVVTASDHKIVASGLGLLVYTGLVPVVTVSDNQVVAPGFGEVVYTGLAPVVTASNHQIVYSDLGLLTYAGFAPVVAISDHQTVAAGFGQLLYEGLAPVVTASDSTIVFAGLGQLLYTGFAPVVTVSDNVLVAAGLGQLVYTGFAATVDDGSSVTIEAGLGQLIYAGYAPIILTGIRRTTMSSPILPPPTIQTGSVVTIFLKSVNLADATVKNFAFRRPAGTVFTRAAGFVTDGTDGGLQYTIQAGDLDEAGVWKICPSVASSGFTGCGQYNRYTVV